MYLDARRHRQARIGIGKLAEEHDLGDATRQQLQNYVEYGNRAVNGLTARHRYRIVVQALLSDINARPERGAHREQPRVIIGAVAEALKYVTGPTEGRLSESIRTSPAPPGEGP